MTTKDNPSCWKINVYMYVQRRGYLQSVGEACRRVWSGERLPYAQDEEV